jgi:putative component of membrane protein insertase Oxa1/YidC/SpoIIIJ protein YidD
MQKSLSKYLLLCSLCALFFSNAGAQSRSDMQLIRAQDFHEHLYDKRKVKFLLSKHKNPIIRYNPVSLFFGGMMYVYQKALSPQISAKCPYEISCSNFSKQCISEYGLIKGVALSADRLTRCTRLASADLTPLDVKDGQKVMDDPKRYRRSPHKK